MKLKFLILNFSFLILTACGVTKPVATTHTERIEERVMPVAVGADTIEITLTCRDTACRVLSTARSKNNALNKRADARQDTARCVPTIHSIASTRAMKLETRQTDSTEKLILTLRPDTVFIPYTNHIRSDTIVIPDRICKTKLQKTQTANVLLILILIIVIIFLFKQKYKFYR